MQRNTLAKALISGGRFTSTRSPMTPPMTMMPSRAMLMMPECSEKQPPRATSIRTMP